MAMIITDECINCGACKVECPTEAVYEPGEGYQVNKKNYPSVSDEYFFIASEICNECEGFEKIRCINVCPMDAIKKL